MKDPTREEMLAHLANLGNDEDSTIPIVAMQIAIHWYASDHHSGQASNLYAALSASPYKPGPLETGLTADTPEGEAYNELCDAFGGGKISKAVEVILIGTRNKSGLIDMEKYAVTCTEDQYQLGCHYDAAKEHATKELDYDPDAPIICIDEQESSFDYIDASFPLTHEVTASSTQCHHVPDWGTLSVSEFLFADSDLPVLDVQCRKCKRSGSFKMIEPDQIDW